MVQTVSEHRLHRVSVELRPASLLIELSRGRNRSNGRMADEPTGTHEPQADRVKYLITSPRCSLDGNSSLALAP
jgi:hypothetical protein